MDKVKWIIFAALSLSILGLLVAFSSGSKLNIDNIDINAIQTANDKDGNIADHVYGKTDSKVTFINYGDFQCPACGSNHPRIKTIVEQYKDKIRFVFRNFPLTSIHSNAKAAAAAAEAAGLQGKYWEMHDKIYENQSDWSSLSESQRVDFFTGYAKNLGLDTAKFSSDIASKNISDKISYDLALGQKAKVEGTPTFYLDGTKLDPSVWGDDAKLKDAIEKELSKN